MQAIWEEAAGGVSQPCPGTSPWVAPVLPCMPKRPSRTKAALQQVREVVLDGYRQSLA